MFGRTQKNINQKSEVTFIIGVGNTVALLAYALVHMGPPSWQHIYLFIAAGLVIASLIFRQCRLNADVVDLGRVHAQLSNAVIHDPLTKLSNRTGFDERLKLSALRAGCTAGEFAVLCLDLDGFKGVNDRLGHPAGDELLTAAASRMQGCLREGDLVARTGGDEFMIILEGDDAESRVRLVAARIIASLREPFSVAGQIAQIGVSVGACVAEGGASPQTLVEMADNALYTAKRSGRGTLHFEAWPADPTSLSRRALARSLAMTTTQRALDSEPSLSRSRSR